MKLLCYGIYILRQCLFLRSLIKMVTLNKENLLKNIRWMVLSLSFTLVACLGNQGGIIRQEHIGVQTSVTKNDYDSLSQELQGFYEEYSESINIVETSPPSDLGDNTEHVPSHCNELKDTSVITNDGDDLTITIYTEDLSPSEARTEIISCGVERLKNQIESSVPEKALIEHYL